MDKVEEEEEGGEEVKEKKMTRKELKKLKKKVREERECVWEGYRLIHSPTAGGNGEKGSAGGGKWFPVLCFPAGD